ncbi:MAG: hypothetical protein KF845_06750 [Cyclobacteriaceae bacterium]|nr:hypothetical protein [Cyclobacteriaceae bacterium]
MKFSKIYLLLIITLTFGCKPEPVRSGEENFGIETVAISELQTNSKAYHLSNVELTGYFNYSFEDVAIYAGKRSGTDEAVWVDFSDNLERSISEELLESLQGRKIRIQGNFDATKTGHMGVYIGTVEITYLETID